MKKTLVQLHVFPYKARKTRNENLQLYRTFTEVLHYLGNCLELQKDAFKILEELACTVSNSKQKSVNQSRVDIFKEKYSKRKENMWIYEF